MATPADAEKHQVATHLLASGGSVYFTLDARVPEVKVPDHLATQAHVVLEIGYNMPVPIGGLHVDSWGWGGTLSFGGKPYYVAVPWAAVYQIAAKGAPNAYTWPTPVEDEAVRGAEAEAEHAPSNVINLAEYRRACRSLGSFPEPVKCAANGNTILQFKRKVRGPYAAPPGGKAS